MSPLTVQEVWFKIDTRSILVSSGCDGLCDGLFCGWGLSLSVFWEFPGSGLRLPGLHWALPRCVLVMWISKTDRWTKSTNQTARLHIPSSLVSPWVTWSRQQWLGSTVEAREFASAKYVVDTLCCGKEININCKNSLHTCSYITSKILQQTLSKFDKQGVGISGPNGKPRVVRMSAQRIFFSRQAGFIVRSKGIHNCTQTALGMCIQGTFALLSVVSTGAVPYPGCSKDGFLHEKGEK